MRDVIDLLQGFDFEITDYLGRRRKEVINSAVSLCRSEGFSGSEVEEAVTVFLDRSCRQRMLESAEWLEPWRIIRNGSVVVARIGEETVEGIVSLSPKRIKVCIQSPLGNMSASLKMRPGAAGAYTISSRRHSSANEYGKERVRELMVDLYYDILAGSSGKATNS